MEKLVFVIRKDFEQDFRDKIISKYEGHIPCELVFQAIDNLPEGFTCPAERTKPWGTNHAVMMGADVIKEPFAVINCDDFYGRDSFQVMGKFLSELPEGSKNKAPYSAVRILEKLKEQGFEGKYSIVKEYVRSGCPVQTVSGALEGGTGMKILKCLLMIVTAPVVLVLTLFVWLCTGLIYISGLVLGLLSTVIALLGVAVLITYSPQNGAILLIMAFLISPMGLPLAAIWLLGKVQSLKFAIQDWVYG